MTVGERADTTSSVMAAVSAYETNFKTVVAGGHCEFDGEAYTSGIQYMIDLKFNYILG